MAPDRTGYQTHMHLLGASDSTAYFKPLPDFSFLRPPLGPDEIGWLAHYRILRLIGIGGMGMVFEAEDTQLQRPVALKVMRPELSALLANRTRFLNEARAAALLASDHVVTVYQVEQDGDVPFLAMQLLRGEPLDARLARAGRLPVAEAVTIAAQAAAGLAAVHDKGLVHRDIKPANLWLEADQSGSTFHRVRVLDLGLVRETGAGSQLTAAGVVVGTPHFMAPEQAGGLPVDPRADLFSLGCVLYTMLSGELAFPGGSTMAVLMALANHTPRPLTTVNPAVPPELAALAAQLMAKAPEDRPGSAAEVIARLGALAATRAHEASPQVRPSGVFSGTTRQQPSTRPDSAFSDTQSYEIVNFNLSGGSSTFDTQPESGMPTPAPRGPVTPPAAPALVSPGAWQRGRMVSVGIGLVAVGVALVVVSLLAFGKKGGQPVPEVGVGPAEPVVVGILHSQSGTMAVSENPVVDATLLAIEEVNAAGGVLGRPVKPVIVDGRSDPEEFARLAEKLLSEDKAVAVFGCWTSASRKAVRPVFERNRGLLFYPVQYEGLEQSLRVVYLGLAPNQQLIPAIDFLTGKLGKKKLFLVGSDYVFPRTAHEIIRDRVRELPDVAVVGESFIPLGSPDVAGVIERIKVCAPDAIVNTLNGGTNFHFFRALRAAGMTAERLPTLSVSIAESEVEGLNPAALAGDYLAAAYFQTVDRPESRAFVDTFRSRYGEGRVVSDPMAGAYCGVHLWAQAATGAGTVDPTAVLGSLRGRQFDGPRGRVTIDPDTRHAWLPVRIGQIRADGQVSLVSGAGTEVPIRPIPYPPSRTLTEWEQFLRGLQFGWNGRWQAPYQ
ncbi:transporter substrate-binding protein [Fimbriiglobus ruber]|uniref:Urea ABC transporter, substrate binding protein UrtA n=1 Tax=Fimbriiglobus ruber TaxID=1908690 RepID=A0A225DSN2_9BACT|nr:transporter substrate-binding protein [Fimbriiglobus ruber]OWK40209.1 Urea ABC transporter, substrate binding protein UrtA [Fimbriiglobus ruber]